MFTLTKINLLWDKVKSLTKKVDDNAIPSHGVADAGKYLGVDASGGLEFSHVPDNVLKVNVSGTVSSDTQTAILNAYTSGKIVYITSGAYLYNVTNIEFMSEGGLLSVTAISVDGDGKMRRFYASDSGSWVPVITENPNIVNYSETEHDTGLKWIDGSTIYEKTIKSISSSGESLELATGVVDLVSASGYIFVSGTTAADISSAYMNSTTKAHIYLAVGDPTNTIFLNCYGDLSSKNFCITIRYTKPAPTNETKKKTKKVKEED